MNVLIDDNEKAVLCDFGLSRLKADVRSNTSMFGAVAVIGSRNWMAPERLTGGSVRKPSDIYAFGMVIYEVNTFVFLSPLNFCLTLIMQRFTRMKHRSGTLSP